MLERRWSILINFQIGAARYCVSHPGDALKMRFPLFPEWIQNVHKCTNRVECNFKNCKMSSYSQKWARIQPIFAKSWNIQIEKLIKFMYASTTQVHRSSPAQSLRFQQEGIQIGTRNRFAIEDLPRYIRDCETLEEARERDVSILRWRLLGYVLGGFLRHAQPCQDLGQKRFQIRAYEP